MIPLLVGGLLRKPFKGQMCKIFSVCTLVRIGGGWYFGRIAIIYLHWCFFIDCDRMGVITRPYDKQTALGRSTTGSDRHFGDTRSEKWVLGENTLSFIFAVNVTGA